MMKSLLSYHNYIALFTFINFFKLKDCVLLVDESISDFRPQINCTIVCLCLTSSWHYYTVLN